MDTEPGDDQQSVTPKVTLARTRELLARSRSTLDEVTKRLETRGDVADRLPANSDSLS